jgi:hypothetical protein
MVRVWEAVLEGVTVRVDERVDVRVDVRSDELEGVPVTSRVTGAVPEIDGDGGATENVVESVPDGNVPDAVGEPANARN